PSGTGIDPLVDRGGKCFCIVGVETFSNCGLANHNMIIAPMKILSTAFHSEFPVWTLPDWAVDELKTHFPGFQIVKLTSSERIKDEAADADILLAAFVKEQQIEAAKRLKWIHAPSAGLEAVLIPRVINSDILVSNSRGVHAISMSEHTMALILA